MGSVTPAPGSGRWSAAALVIGSLAGPHALHAWADPAPPGRGGVRIGEAYVTTLSDRPENLEPAAYLTHEEQIGNFDALTEAIAAIYPLFEIKSIDWPAIVELYRAHLRQPLDTDQFYFLLFRLVNELQDYHSMLLYWGMRYLPYGPDLAVDLIEGKPIITYVPDGSSAERQGVKVGWEILSVDGMEVEDRCAWLRPFVKAYSSTRAERRALHRYLLRNKTDAPATVLLRSPEGVEAEVALDRRRGAFVTAPRTYAFPVTRQQFVQYGQHPSGVGYVHIPSFGGKQEIADDFDRALEALRDALALMIDVRGNLGGSSASQRRIIGRLIQQKALGSIGHLRTLSETRGLDVRESYYEPQGSWQYTKPVALLTDDLTGSAADLFVCCLTSVRDVLVVGAATHGNLTGNSKCVVLPCNVVVRVSCGYVCDASGRAIEGSGTMPDISVEPSVADLLVGVDPVIERAASALRQRP